MGLFLTFIFPLFLLVSLLPVLAELRGPGASPWSKPYASTDLKKKKKKGSFHSLTSIYILYGS